MMTQDKLDGEGSSRQRKTIEKQKLYGTQASASVSVTDKVVTIATSNNKSVSVEVAYHVPNSVSRVDDPPNQQGFLLLEKAYNTTTETKPIRLADSYRC